MVQVKIILTSKVNEEVVCYGTLTVMVTVLSVLQEIQVQSAFIGHSFH